MIYVHITWMIIPRVGLLESAVDWCNILGEGFGQVVMFSPKINVPIKYTSNFTVNMLILILKRPLLFIILYVNDTN